MTKENDMREADRDGLDSLKTIATASSYKILGEIDAPDGVAIRGKNTATSGLSYGVEGITDSPELDAAGVHAVGSGDAAGVYAEATGPGEAFKGYSNEDNGAEIWTDEPYYAGIQGDNNATYGNSFGVEGTTGATSSGSDTPAGVFGDAFASTGTNYGVLGKSASDDENAAGVRGAATNTSGFAEGVVGEARVDNGSGPATGALGFVYDDTNATDADGARTEYVGAYGAAQKGPQAETGQAWGVAGITEDKDGVGAGGFVKNGSGENYGVVGRTNSTSGYGVYSVGDLYVEGDVQASGTKPFVQTVQTDSGPREIVYTAVEAAGVRTEVSGVTSLTGGRAEVSLPDHFDQVTDSDEPLIVQTTPYGGSSGLKVTSQSTEKIVVEDLDGQGSYRFAYNVRGTREGYANSDVVRKPGTAAPSGQSDKSSGAPAGPSAGSISHPDPPDRSHKRGDNENSQS